MDTKAFVQDSISRSLDKYLELHPDGGGAAIQVSTLPEASAEEEGKIYQFIGATTADYTNGYFYECVEILPATDPKMYQWVQKDVQPGGASGDYQAGQGIRIQNAVIDTPLLDDDYEKEIVPLPGLVPSIEEQIFPVGEYASHSYAGIYFPGTTDRMVASDWDNYFSLEALTRDKATLWIKTTEDSNWHMVTGYVHGDNGNKYPMYDLHPDRTSSDAWPYFSNGGEYIQCVSHSESIRITGVKRELTINVPGMVDTPIHVHQLSGIVKEDYADEWFTDLTEQDVHQGVEHAFTQGAVTIQEQYSVGEEVLIGTWKENNVVYDLYRKVIDFGALPNASIKSVDTGIVGGVKMVYANVSVYHSVTALGYGIYNSGSLYDWTMCTLDKIHIRTETDKSAMSATVVIEYTKARG